MTKVIPCVVAVLGLGLLLGPDGRPSATVDIRPNWTETKWPFLLDQWGVGRAFVCTPEDCGSEVKIYLRPKFGFCNCTAEALSDGELDRVGDNALIASEAIAFGPGRSVDLAWMKGHSRTFLVRTDKAAAGKLLSIAFHDNCDLMVAVATFAPGNSAVEPAIFAFLGSDRILRWVKWLTL
jgi:hypothetical protein